MNILFITDNFPPETNAAAARVFERAGYWIRWGHQVTVLTSCPNSPKGKVYPGYKNRMYQSEIMEGVKVIRVKTYITPNKGIVRRCLDFFSFMLSAIFFGMFQKKPDVVVASSPQLFSGVAGLVLSKRFRVPFVLELADLWPESIIAVGVMPRNHIIKALELVERLIYRYSNVIITLTQGIKARLLERGIPEYKIETIINGYDKKTFENCVEKESIILKNNLQLNYKFIIGYIGTFGMAQGLEHVVDAAKLLNYDNNIHFLFVGDGAEKKKIVNLVQNYELTNFTFVDNQPKHKIAAYWRCCDVALVHLKNSDLFRGALPSKLFEAMGMGLPILLAAPEGEATALLEKENVGMSVDSGNESKLAKVISEMYINTEKRIEFRKNSKLAAEKYTRETQAKKFIDVLITFI